MKPFTRRSFTAAGILAALGLTSCKGDFNPSINSPAAVYGPPPEYDPKVNELDDVYGPPPEDTDDADEQTDSDFEPARNVPAPVYGPPPSR